MVLCSALSRLRASSTHAAGKLAIEAASPFLIRPRLEFSYNRTEATRLGYRSSGTVERQHDTKAVRRRKIAFAPLCPGPRQFSESHDDLVVIGGIPTLEGRIPMSDGAGATSRSSCHGQQRRLADGFVPLESDRRHCRIRLHRSRTLFISVPFRPKRLASTSGTRSSNPLSSTGESKANPISWIMVDADARSSRSRDADHRPRPAVARALKRERS
jgi:hypothetical protein